MDRQSAHEHSFCDPWRPLRQERAVKRLALFLMMGAVSSSIGWAEVCSGVPQCEQQQQAAVSYNADQTRGWAYYCTGDHPYYWGASWAGLSGQWVQTNKCFT